ncbi:MAG: hypothetical protein WCL16_03745 [bacterium]
MSIISSIRTTQARARAVCLSIASLLLPAVLSAQTAPTTALPPVPAAGKSPWSFAASLTLKETFDSNVYIQDATPDSANVAAADAAGFSVVPARHGSFITSVLPQLGLDYKPCPAFYASATYAPEINYYHSASSEDYAAQRGTLNLGGKLEETVWELFNAASYIDGNELGPVFARPGDIPAVGGIALRDRREAFIFRNGFKLTCPVSDLFIRPVATTYFHDFKTDQRLSPAPTVWVYENYIDRQEVSGGLDVGYKIARQTHIVLGYRYGVQDQGALLGTDSPYDNSYQRILVGVEGSPAEWLKLAVAGGPDIRNFSSAPKPDFDASELLYYIDASITLLPTARDLIVLANKRYEQPAFSSFSMYEDITYSFTWRHKLDEHFTVGPGFQLYIGDWQSPVIRDDWIYTPSASVAYNYNKINVELAYSYDWAENNKTVVAGTSTAYADGREFSRSLVSLRLKYTF